MKRYYAIFIILVLMLSICGCSQTNVNNNADVTLTFIYGEENVIDFHGHFPDPGFLIRLL